MVNALVFFAFSGISAASELTVRGRFTPVPGSLHGDVSSAVRGLARLCPSSHGRNDCSLGESYRHVLKLTPQRMTKLTYIIDSSAAGNPAIRSQEHRSYDDAR
jgi:hypothetical protein